jgi:hypothetical protein
MVDLIPWNIDLTESTTVLLSCTLNNLYNLLGSHLRLKIGVGSTKIGF